MEMGYFTYRFIVDPAASLFSVRYGADLGRGGYIALATYYVVAQRWTDMWWGGNYNNANQYLATNTTVYDGYNMMEIRGAECCCDGASNFQFSVDLVRWYNFGYADLIVCRLQVIIKTYNGVQPTDGASAISNWNSGGTVICSMNVTSFSNILSQTSCGGPSTFVKYYFKASIFISKPTAIWLRAMQDPGNSHGSVFFLDGVADESLYDLGNFHTYHNWPEVSNPRLEFGVHTIEYLTFHSTTTGWAVSPIKILLRLGTYANPTLIMDPIILTT